MTLNLHELDTTLEPVRFVQGGPEYAFHHIDGIGEQLLMSLAGTTGLERLRIVKDILARCIPDAPREAIDALPSWKADLLISLASKAVKTVQEYMDQIEGKAETTGDVSPSETPSATPSPELPRRSAGERRKSGAVRIG